MKLKILLLIFLFSGYLPTNGQILYTDFSPDIYLTNQPLGSADSAAIDIDQDAIVDFTAFCTTFFSFVHQQCCWNTDNRIHLNPTEISLAFASVNGQALCGRLALDSNVLVDSSFYYPTNYTEAYFYRSGNLAMCGYSLPTVPKFYPFRKTVNNDTLYGWIRIEANPTYMIIYDAAINLSLNAGLFTGQTLTGIDNSIPANNYNIFPNPFDKELTITVTNINQSEIFIYDITGKMLLQKKFTKSITLETSAFEKGIYIYEIRNKSGFYKGGKLVKA